MTIYGKICSQQDWAAEAAKAEATEQYRGPGRQTDQSMGKDPGYNAHPVYFYTVETERSLVSSQTGACETEQK